MNLYNHLLTPYITEPIYVLVKVYNFHIFFPFLRIFMHKIFDNMLTDELTHFSWEGKRKGFQQFHA